MTGNATHSTSSACMGDAGSLEAIARLRAEPEYTMQAVNQRTGVPADTLRSWERRHGFPRPERSGANRRLYSERDIAGIIWLRRQIAQGQGTAAAVHQLLSHLRRATPEADAMPPSDDTAAPDVLVTALRAGRAGDARRAWDRLALATSVEGLCMDVLLPADRLLREAHRTGSLSAPGLRRAQAFLLRKATVLLDHAGPDEGDPLIGLVAGADGLLPATVLGVLLARSGAAVATPIADTTLEAVALLREAAPDHVVLVSPSPSPGAELATLVDALGSSRVAVWKAGQPLAGHIPSALEQLPTDPQAAVAALVRRP